MKADAGDVTIFDHHLMELASSTPLPYRLVRPLGRSLTPRSSMPVFISRCSPICLALLGLFACQTTPPAPTPLDPAAAPAAPQAKAPSAAQPATDAPQPQGDEPLRCDVDQAQLTTVCPEDQRCIRGLRPPDWQEAICAPTRSSDAIYTLPLVHSRGVQNAHSSGEGSHSYYADFFAMDLRSPPGERGQILAARDGEVVYVVDSCPDHDADGVDDPCGSGYGNQVRLLHEDGDSSLYAHFSRVDVKLGQRLKAGEVLGLEGASGRAGTKHLHFVVQRRPEENPQGDWRAINYQLRIIEGGLERLIWADAVSCAWQKPCPDWMAPPSAPR